MVIATKERQQLGQQALDPQDVLEHLKADNQVLHWEPLPPVDRNGIRAPGQTRVRDHLEYLHQHWDLPDSLDRADAGGGLRGGMTRLVGKVVFRVLRGYLNEERELLARVVQASQALEHRCDELTVRCQELSEQIVDRQVAEAANQARLAAWLHAEPLARREWPPATSVSPAGGAATGPAARGQSGRSQHLPHP